MNVNTQSTRPRLWNGHDYSYRDSLNWLKGTHLIQFGGEYFHQWFHFDRYDNVVGGLTQLKYLVGNGGVQFTPDTLPRACSDRGHHELLARGVRTAQLPGHLRAVVCRGGWNDLSPPTWWLPARDPNLNLNPLGTPVASYATVENYSLYFNDAWRIKPNLTLNYGLNYGVQMPPYELNGAQDVLVDSEQQPSLPRKVTWQAVRQPPRTGRTTTHPRFLPGGYRRRRVEVSVQAVLG